MSGEPGAVDPRTHQSSAYELNPQPASHLNPWIDTGTRIHGGIGSIRIDERKQFRAVKTTQKHQDFQNTKPLERELTALFTLSHHERIYVSDLVF